MYVVFIIVMCKSSNYIQLLKKHIVILITYWVYLLSVIADKDGLHVGDFKADKFGRWATQTNTLQ